MNNTNKIINVLKTAPHQNSLDQEIRHIYTPSLWGNQLVKRSSFEGRAIDFIRSFHYLDNSKRQWKHLFRDLFNHLNKQEIETFSIPEQNKLYILKHTYDKKSLPTSPYSNLPKHKTKPKNIIPAHWTKDPEELKKLSLLRQWNPNDSENIDTHVLENLFGLQNEHTNYSQESFNKISLHVNQVLEKKTPNINKSIESIVQDGNLTETKLQAIITEGAGKPLSEATTKLRHLSKETTDSLNTLKANERRLIFGGTLAIFPKLNISDLTGNEAFKKFEKFLSSEDSEELINTIIEKICKLIDQIGQIPQPSDEFSAEAKKILEDGLIAFAFPKLKESLLTPEQSIAKKALLAVPELLRYGTEKALSFAERKMIEDMIESFSGAVTKELCLELFHSALDANPKEIIKEKLQVHLKQHLTQFRETLVTNFISLAGDLPSIAPELIKALGYGDLGAPECPLWFEIIRQPDEKPAIETRSPKQIARESIPFEMDWYEDESDDDSLKDSNKPKFSLLIYATGQGASFQGAVPLIYENLTQDQLDEEFFLRLFSYRAWPKWDKDVQYSLKDLHKGLLANLKSEPMAPAGPLKSLLNDLQNTQSVWGLFKGLISNHCQFDTEKAQNLFFFNWKKKALMDLWMSYQINPKLVLGPKEKNSIKMAAEMLIAESLKHYEDKIISLDELKGLYATTWEILDALKTEDNEVQIGYKKSNIIPSELAESICAFFNKIPSKSDKDSFLIKNLLVDILGKQVEPVLDEVFCDLYPEQTHSNKNSLPSPLLKPLPEETTSTKLIRLGKKFTNVLLDVTMGFNINDVTSPTLFSYLKIAYGVSRLAYSILFTQFSLALSLKWRIGYIASQALTELAQIFLPKQVLYAAQLAEFWKNRLEEWKLRMFAYATARLLLSTEQQEAFTQLISELQMHLTNGGKLSFELPSIILPPQETLSLKKIVPLIPVKHDSILPTKKYELELPKPVMTLENCRHFLYEIRITAQKMVPDPQKLKLEYHGILKAGINFPEDAAYKKCKEIIAHAENKIENKKKLVFYLNEQIKALPMPLSGDLEDFWSQVSEPQLYLEEMASLSLTFFQNTDEVLPRELRNQGIISLYKAYAIMDKLARRCPEAKLEGCKVNPWALAFVKRNAFFQIVDPHALTQMKQVCTYFGIDFDKDYSDSEIGNYVNESLFLGSNKSNFYLDDTFGRGIEVCSNKVRDKFQSNYRPELTPPEYNYYSDLLKKPEIQKKLIKLGISSDAPFSEKLGAVYSNGKEHCKTNSSEELLPRPFHLLRLINLLANNYTNSVIAYKMNCDIDTINDSHISFTKHDDDSRMRIVLNRLTFGNFFKKDKTWIPFKRLEPLTPIVRTGISNAAFKENLVPNVTVDYAIKLFQHRFNAISGRVYNSLYDYSTFTSVITNKLHLPSRSQNKIVNETSGFDTLRTTGLFYTGDEKVTQDNILMKLPKNERAAIEMIWADETDQAVRTLAYFSQKIGHFNNFYFILLFEILLLRSNILEQQLKTSPAFAKILGEFFKVALSHYDRDKDLETHLSIIELGICSLIKAKVFNPSAEKFFPDFSDLLTAIPAPTMKKNETRKPFVNIHLSNLFTGLHYFENPSTASLDVKRKACHDFLQGFFWSRTTTRDSCSTHVWTPTIAKTLNDFPEIRNECLNALAWKMELLPQGKKGSWKGVYPNFYCGLIHLNVDLEEVVASQTACKDKINEQLNSIFTTERSTNYVKGHCEVCNEELTIDVEQSDSDEQVKLIFRKWHKGISYRWVNSNNPSTNEKVTYWLEEVSPNHQGPRELLTLNDGKVIKVEAVNKLAKGTYSFVIPRVSSDIKIDLTKEQHHLSLLTWFQPLSKINAFRSSLSPYGLKRIEFSALNLRFNIEEIAGKKRAISDGSIPGFYIAEEQRPAKKIPALDHHSRYLLLENNQKQHRVVLPSDVLLSSAASWLMKKTTQLTSSHLIDAGFSKAIDALLPDQINKEIPPYFVYSLDEKGRLTSEDPAALIHLLLYSLAEGQWSEISHYLTLIEGIGKRMPFPAAVFPLIQYIESIAMLINDPTIVRIALRLAAVREENELIQIDPTKTSSENIKELFRAWLTLQVNFYRNYNRRESVPQLPLDEYQELFILHAIAKKGEKFIFNNSAFIKIAKDHKTLIDMIGLKNLSETLLMPSEISQRYAFLKHKYAFKDEYRNNFSAFLQGALQDHLLKTSPLKPTIQSIVDSKGTVPSEEVLPGMQENALLKLISMLSQTSQHSLSCLIPQSYLKYSLPDYSESFQTSIDFFSNYRKIYYQDEVDGLQQRVLTEAHQKKLHGIPTCIRTKTLLCIMDPKQRDFFPNPDLLDLLFDKLNLSIKTRHILKIKDSALALDENQKINEINLQITEIFKQAPIKDSALALDENQKINQINLQITEMLKQAQCKSLAYQLSVQWEEASVKVEDLSFDQLSSHFLGYYQLALEKPPLACQKDSHKMKSFIAKAKSFRRTLLFAQGKNSVEKKLLETLRLASQGSFITSFPNPQQFEKDLLGYIDILEKLEKIKLEFRLNKNLSYNQEIKLGQEENKLERILLNYSSSIIFSFPDAINNACSIASTLPETGNLLTSVVKQKGQSLLMMTAASYLTPIPAPLLMAAQTGFAAYKGLQIYDTMSKKYRQIEEDRSQAKIERIAQFENNRKTEPPLPSEYLSTLEKEEASFTEPLHELLKLHFTPPVVDSKSLDPISPFDCPSNKPFIKKAFAALNKSLEDFYARPKPEAIPEEFCGIENYHQLKSKLEHFKTQLSLNLSEIRKKLLQPKSHPATLPASDEMGIFDAIKERKTKKNIAQDFQSDDLQLNALIMAFVNNDEKEMMRCTSCEERHLPKLKLKIYQYLLKTTRLQQINRALDIQKKIDPTQLNDSEMKIRLKQLTFELSRKRAYSFSEKTHPRLLRGYLAFEYGSGMMLWDKQVNQLQRMLLSDQKRSILELIMGSGKTVFGTPMTDFFGSDGSQIVANFFPDALAPENIQDLSSRSMNFFGQTANAFKISRDNPPNEENLWGLHRLLMRALDQKESLNGCKKDFQALQLLFIEEAHKAIHQKDSINESLLWSYMQLLGFIRKNVRANIDEAHRLLRYNDELNHPLGEKKKVKQSYVNVISECMRLLVAIPEVQKNIPLENNDQTLCSLEKYHQSIKPLIAKQMTFYRPFAISPKHRQAFVDFFCGNLKEIPDFILTHSLYKEMSLVVGVLNKFLPDALQKKVNVQFGTKGNTHGYAQPYSGKDNPIEGSTFKNPFEAVLKTLMASLHAPMDQKAVELLVMRMKAKAMDQSTNKGIPFEKTRAARLFASWTDERYQLKDVSFILNDYPWNELTTLLSKGYAPRMTYARFYAVPEIEYFAENMCCNSQNFASMFPSFYGGTGTPSTEELCPTGTKVFWDPGTAGEFIDHICHTCTEDKISEGNKRSPHETLDELLKNEFGANSHKLALIDSGSLLYGLSNETVAEIILEHIAKKRLDLEAVVYFDSKNKKVIQEKGKKAVPYAESSIPPEKRITYFDHSHTVGADILQAIGAGGQVSINEKSLFEDFMQGCWRMRGLKTAKQDISLNVNKAAKQVITDKEKLNARDVVTFTKNNEALHQEEGIFPSAQQQVDNVIRTAVLDAMYAAEDVKTMLNYFKKFSFLFVSTSNEDPSHYGNPEVEIDSTLALEELCKHEFKSIENSSLFKESEKKAIWNTLMEVGEGSTFPEKVKLYKKDGKLVSRKDDLGMAQHVSVQASQQQTQNQDASRNQDAERNQNTEKEQNQNLQMDVCLDNNLSKGPLLRLEPAAWSNKIDYFASLDWWNVLQNSSLDNEQVSISNVKTALSKAKNKTMNKVAEAFEGMYWTNNLQGILANDDLAEPCSKKQMLQLLVIQGPLNSGTESSVLTCAIDQTEAKLWRKRLENGQGPVKIALFDIALNEFVVSGNNPFNEEALLKDRNFNFTIARWKFLAGHTNLQNVEDILKVDFQKWISDNNIKRMKKVFEVIYKAYGFASLNNSYMQMLFSTDENDGIPDIM